MDIYFKSTKDIKNDAIKYFEKIIDLCSASKFHCLEVRFDFLSISMNKISPSLLFIWVSG